jgi:3-dehydroquinate dehydratase II
MGRSPYFCYWPPFLASRMKKQILILNGPNLNLLGQREPGIYGTRGFADYFTELQGLFPEVTLEYFQSNHEGELIDKLHEVGFSYQGVVFNAGGYTHTSVALGDAVAAISTPVVEVHISNVHAREPFRHHSYLSKNCTGIIVGFGLEGYRLAVDFLVRK